MWRMKGLFIVEWNNLGEWSLNKVHALQLSEKGKYSLSMQQKIAFNFIKFAQSKHFDDFFHPVRTFLIRFDCDNYKFLDITFKTKNSIKNCNIFHSRACKRSHHHENADHFSKKDVSHEGENKLAQNEARKLHKCEEKSINHHHSVQLPTISFIFHSKSIP